jgi:hypothetical protein
MREKSNFENIKSWVILLKILGLVLICSVIFNMIQRIIGIDLTFLMWATIYILSLYILLHSLRINDISVKKIMGELSLANVPWMALISIKIFLILFSWLSQSVWGPLVAIFYPEIYTEVFTSFLEEESVNTADFNMMMLIISFTLAPIFEEFLFRGYLLNKWGAKIGILKAMVASSLLFAFLHFDILVLLAYFAIGVFYSLIYLKTKKLIVPIILHSLTNLISSVSVFFPSFNLTSVEALEHVVIVSAIIYIILIPTIVFILYSIYKRISISLPYEYNRNVYS